MKLNEYIKVLSAIKRTHGGDLEVIYAADDEGNSFNAVHYHPTPGYWRGGKWGNGEWVDYKHQDLKAVGLEDAKINSVCIN